MLSNTIANGFMSMDGTGTYYSTQDLQTAYDYCISHASDIVAGKNPVQDLVASKLISPDFTGMTCDQVKTEKGLKQSHDGLMNELANLD